MSKFEDYADKYANVRMERRDGILEITFHTDGDSLVWGDKPLSDLGYAFTDIGTDRDNKVVIVTGAGEDFCTKFMAPGIGSRTAGDWDVACWGIKRLLTNLLDIEVPMIGAVNGQAVIHSELALLCDIVLAEENAVFQDLPHFPGGMVPGDGVHVLWPLLLGPTRGKYFLLTGQKLSAREALELGVVNEVVPRENLLPRARELAEQLASKPLLALRYTRFALNLQMRRLMQDMLGYGVTLEALAAMDK